MDTEAQGANGDPLGLKMSRYVGSGPSTPHQDAHTAIVTSAFPSIPQQSPERGRTALPSPERCL